MNTYYNPEDLAKFSTMGEEAPKLWESFMNYYGQVFADGALSAKEKSLIAFAVALTVASCGGDDEGGDRRREG